MEKSAPRLLRLGSLLQQSSISESRTLVWRRFTTGECEPRPSVRAKASALDHAGPGSVRYACSFIAVTTCAFIIGSCRPGDDRSSPPKSPSAPPRRIVSISPSATEIICALGACDRLVGIDRFSNFPPEVTSLPRVGGLDDPELETLVSLRPDLVILRGRQAQVEEICKRRDIAIYHDPTNTLSDVYETIRELGDILDRVPQGDEIVLQMQHSFARTRQRCHGRRPPRVLFVVSRAEDRLARIYTIGKGSFLTEIVEIAGGRPLFGDEDIDYLEVSLERIVAADPEVIIDAFPGRQWTAAEHQNLIAQWDTLPTISAVKEGRIHVVTDSYVTIPSPRLAELADDLADWFHPASPPTS